MKFYAACDAGIILKRECMGLSSIAAMSKLFLRYSITHSYKNKVFQFSISPNTTFAACLGLTQVERSAYEVFLMISDDGLE